MKVQNYQTSKFLKIKKNLLELENTGDSEKL